MNRPKFDLSGFRGLTMGRKPLFCLALSALVGLMAAWHATRFAFLGWWLVGASVLLFAALFFIPKGKLAFACAAMLMLSAGYLYCRLPVWWGHDMLAGQEKVFSATVSDVRRYSSYVVLTATDVSVGDSRQALSPMQGNLRLELTEPDREYRVGDQILLRARAESPAAPNLRGVQDERAIAFARNIRCFLRPEEADVLVLGHTEPQGLGAWIRNLRANIAASIDAAFPADCAAFIKALTVGETSGMESSDRQSFARLGLSHVLAISGLHVSLLFDVIQKIGRKLGAWEHGIRIASVLMLALYLVIADFRLSLLRVVYMQSIRYLSDHQCRKYDALSALSAGFLFQIALTPGAFLDMGFQMSYLSTASILLFQEPVRWLDRTKFKVLSPMALTLVVSIGSLPYLLLNGMEFAPLSFLGNLIFVPLMPVVLVACLLWLAFLPVFPAGFLPLTMALEWLTTAYLSGIDIVAARAGVVPLLVGFGWFAVPYFASLLYLSPAFGALRWKEGALAGMVFLFSTAGLFFPQATVPGIYVIGSGDVVAVLAATKDETCLVMEDPVENLPDILRQRRYTAVDRLILTGTAAQSGAILSDFADFPIGSIELPGQTRSGVIDVETQARIAGMGEKLTLRTQDWSVTVGEASLMEGDTRVEIQCGSDLIRIGCCPWQTDTDENVGLNGVYCWPRKE